MDSVDRILKNQKLIRELYEINAKFKHGVSPYSKVLRTHHAYALIDLFNTMRDYMMKEVELNKNRLTYKQLGLVLEAIDRMATVVKLYEEGETICEDPIESEK